VKLGSGEKDPNEGEKKKSTFVGREKAREGKQETRKIRGAVSHGGTKQGRSKGGGNVEARKEEGENSV